MFRQWRPEGARGDRERWVAAGAQRDRETIVVKRRVAHTQDLSLQTRERRGEKRRRGRRAEEGDFSKKEVTWTLC